MMLTEKAAGCQCEYCQWYHKFKQHLANVHEDSQGFFSEMADELVSLQEEHSIAEAIIDGSWPSADRIISFRRKKLETKNAQKLLETKE